MEPMAVVIGALAVLYLAFGVVRFVAPARGVAFERRFLYSTPTRMRIMAIGLGAAIGVPLIVTSRMARAVHGELTLWVEFFGWYAAVFSIWMFVAPAFWQRFAEGFWDAVEEPALRRAAGVLTLAFGLGCAWVASIVR
jgi:hypothetical protein